MPLATIKEKSTGANISFAPPPLIAKVGRLFGPQAEGALMHPAAGFGTILYLKLASCENKLLILTSGNSKYSELKRKIKVAGQHRVGRFYSFNGHCTLNF